MTCLPLGIISDKTNMPAQEELCYFPIKEKHFNRENNYLQDSTGTHSRLIEVFFEQNISFALKIPTFVHVLLILFTVIFPQNSMFSFIFFLGGG